MAEDKRLESIVEVLLDYTLLQFDKQIELSDKGDQIDAIAAGINTIGEELKHALEEERKTKKQLEEYSKRLETRNRELEEFIYITSHDLQEPLQSVKSFSEIIQSEYAEKLPKESSYMFHQIDQSTFRMSRQIHGLLEYLRIGEKKEVGRVNVLQAVQEAIEKNTPLIENRKARVHIGTLPEINGHSEEITILFDKLINNALIFTEKEKHPEIHISGEETENGWIFKVKDNGIGIEETHFKRIFRIFQRLHSRSEYSGIGMGLSICQKIAELHKGDIYVDSKLGEGSTFTLFLSKDLPELNTNLQSLTG